MSSLWASCSAFSPRERTARRGARWTAARPPRRCWPGRGWRRSTAPGPRRASRSVPSLRSATRLARQRELLLAAGAEPGLPVGVGQGERLEFRGHPASLVTATAAANRIAPPTLSGARPVSRCRRTASRSPRREGGSRGAGRRSRRRGRGGTGARPAGRARAGPRSGRRHARAPSSRREPAPGSRRPSRPRGPATGAGSASADRGAGRAAVASVITRAIGAAAAVCAGAHHAVGGGHRQLPRAEGHDRAVVGPRAQALAHDRGGDHEQDDEGRRGLLVVDRRGQGRSSRGWCGGPGGVSPHILAK